MLQIPERNKHTMRVTILTTQITYEVVLSWSNADIALGQHWANPHCCMGRRNRGGCYVITHPYGTYRNDNGQHFEYIFADHFRNGRRNLTKSGYTSSVKNKTENGVVQEIYQNWTVRKIHLCYTSMCVYVEQCFVIVHLSSLDTILAAELLFQTSVFTCCSVGVNIVVQVIGCSEINLICFNSALL